MDLLSCSLICFGPSVDSGISLTGKLVRRYFEAISLESFVSLAVIGELVVGAAYFRLIERPFMATTDLAWLKRILRLRD